jgi:hypothetical protein
MMRFKSGNHEGKTAEEVFIKHPDFAQWTIERYPESPHGQAFIRLTQQFDDKPFTADCHRECGQKATRASANRDGSLLFFWCDNCDPFSTGAHGLRIIHALSESLQHVDLKAGVGGKVIRREINEPARQLAHGRGGGVTWCAIDPMENLALVRWALLFTHTFLLAVAVAPSAFEVDSGPEDEFVPNDIALFAGNILRMAITHERQSLRVVNRLMLSEQAIHRRPADRAVGREVSNRRECGRTAVDRQ